MKKATLITHQGWADHFSCNGIVNHYAEKFDEITLFAIDKNVANMLAAMYFDKPNIKISIPHLTFFENVDTTYSTCMKCHMQGSSLFCPRQGGRCEYVDYSKYPGCKNIKIGAFKGYQSWERFMRSSTDSFAHCFYQYEGLSPKLRIEKFAVSSCSQLKFNSNNYSVIHDDPIRGIVIPRTSESVVQLNQLSKTMIDTVEILENAKQIDLIDSNYSVLVYLLSFHNEKIASIPKTLHASARSNRDLGIYQNPVPKMWSSI